MHSFRRVNNLSELLEIEAENFTLHTLQINGGVWAFARNERVAAFFKRWQAQWEKHAQRDQGALVRALYADPLKIFYLGNEWNTFDKYTKGIAAAAIKHYPGRARRWAGMIPGRIDSATAWARVAQFGARPQGRRARRQAAVKIVENDPTQNMATPVVIVAAIRSGGTFLAHCLSNHPQIYCDRGEPLHHRSVWCATTKIRRQQLLAVLTNQTGYAASACKLTYMQAFDAEVWGWLEKQQPRVIWLRRGNAVRQAVSVLLNQAARRGELKLPQHSFEPVAGVRVTLSPGLVVKAARGLTAQDERAWARLAGLPEVLKLTYADVTGGESAERLPVQTARRVCNYLGVRYEPMGCDLVRVNPLPLREIIGNWKAVRSALMQSEFAADVEDELDQPEPVRSQAG